MKKVLSVLLATLMFITLLMPLSVFAANGPYPVDWDNMTEEKLEELESMSYIAVMDMQVENMGYVYPKAIADILPVNSKGISYNEKTNTLTLNNFKTNNMLVLCAMGDDFKIKLSGYNEVGCIVSSDLNWGGSVTVTGSGVLVVNKNKTYPEAVVLDVTGTGYGFFKIEKSVAVRLFGTSADGIIDCSIGVFGTKEADSSKVIIINGTNNAEKTETYPVYVYEQEKVFVTEKFETEGYGEFLVSKESGKEDNLYFGKHTEEAGSYDVYEVAFDSELNNYVLVPVEGLVNVSPSQCKMEELYDKSNVPEIIVEVSSEAVDMDKCIDADGNDAVFVDNSEYIVPLEDVEVYKVVNHSKYGKVAITVTPSKEYKELKNIEGKTTYNHANYTQILTVNKIVTKAPGKVTLKKAENAYGGVKITWNAVSGADKYIVYRSQYSGGKWSKWANIGSSTTTSYLDETAKNGGKYKYTVRAKNIVGLGAYDTTGVSTTYIAAPTAKIKNASNGIKVSWSKVSGATGYTVYRSQYSGGKWSGWKNMGTTKADKTSWTDKSVKTGVQYKYTVRTVKSKLASGYKATSGLVFLSMPTVKIQNASTGVKVSWSKATGATGYTVYRSEYANGKWSSWKNMGTAKASKSSWVDKSAKSGVQYKYTVRAINGSSASAYKESAKLLYLAQPTTNIENASNGIKVSWNKSAGAKGYTVYRSEYVKGKWSSWKTMGTAAATKTSWVDKSVKSGVQYKYTVRAVNGKVKSAYVASNDIMFLSAPNVTYKNVKTGIKLEWTKSAGAKQYVIYRASNINYNGWTDAVEYKVVDGKTTSWIDTEVLQYSIYSYEVYAVNGNSVSKATSTTECVLRDSTDRGLW